MTQRNKQNGIQYHYVRDDVATDNPDIRYCATEAITAGALTEPLDRVKTARFAQDMDIWARKSSRDLDQERESWKCDSLEL